MTKISVTLEEKQWLHLIYMATSGHSDLASLHKNMNVYEDATHALNNMERQIRIGQRVIETNKVS